MNLQEQQLHYPFGDALPPAGSAIEVAAGVKWLRMPLPFALDHINLWLLRDEVDRGNGVVSGWTVVDCGVSNTVIQTHWETIFANELEGLPIVRVVVTHMHPDHIGLAHWLCDRWQAPLHISSTDYLQARLGVEQKSSFGGDRAAAFFALHGMTNPDDLAQIRGRTHYYSGLVPAVPQQFHRLMDGARLAIGVAGQRYEWQCISGYGHAPEHIALYCPNLGLLISGDMVLPRISTNVSVYEGEPESNPLKLFLDSIKKFAACEDSTMVLPSHGKPFVGLHTRVAQLQAHHDERLADLQHACQQAPMTAMDALPVLFKRPLDLHQTTFALGEAVAHLHYLWFNRQVKRLKNKSGAYQFEGAGAGTTGDLAPAAGR